MKIEAATPWLIQPRGLVVAGEHREPRVRLYCFPYSGGNAAAFVPWQRAIDPAIELCPVQLPGRGARFNEPLCTSFSTLIADLAQMLVEQTALSDLPFAFFGHSLGSLIAFELARYCQQHGLTQPQRLIVSGCNAPPLKTNKRRLHELPDEELLARLREYNGTPEEVLNSRELMRLLLPVVRADFALGADYQYQPDPLLGIPVTACTGCLDPHVDAAGMAAWAKLTQADFRLHSFNGDHFYIQPQQAALLRCLADELLMENCLAATG